MDDSADGPISDAELALWASGVCVGLRPMSPESLSGVRDIYEAIENRRALDAAISAARAG